jgi:glycosyltransferase involved in cell wall biosynthesis
MTRVLFVHSSAGHYGADRQLALLARTLDRDRVSPLALLPFDGPLGDDLRAAGVEVLTGSLAVLRRESLRPRGLGRLAADLARQRPALQRLISTRRIDVVHANTSVLLGLRRVAPRLVTHVREIYPRTPGAWPAHRRAILAADRVLCVSGAVRTALDPAGDHVRVVHDGLAIDPQRAPRDQARLALGLPRDAFVVAVLGRISAWKGQEVLVRALGDLPDAVGLVAGDTWPGQEQHAERLRRLAAELGVGERLRLAGFREDVDTVYGAADVVVVPSTKPDPLPNSALEAAAAGCCVVAAAHGGLPEILRDHRTGRLFVPGDHRALATVLAGLAKNPKQRAQLGSAAAADVRARFAPEVLARRVEAIYEEIVRNDDVRPFL